MIVPLTSDIITKFYGAHQPRTVRGYAVMDGDAIEAIFGIYLDHDYWVVFSDTGEKMRSNINAIGVKKTIIRCMKLLRSLLKSVSLPVVSVAEKQYEKSVCMLEHFGCAKLQGEVYLWQA